MSLLQCGLTGWLGPLRHQVSLLYVHDSDRSNGDRQFIVTGSKAGHLWLWDILPPSETGKGGQLSPRVLLLGHKAPIRAVVYCGVSIKSPAAPFNHAIITASEDGSVTLSLSLSVGLIGE